MTVPGIVQSTLEGEEIAARVSLGGDDELFITPSSTLIYRAEGLLSDESVDEFPHDADRLTLSEKRRKTKFTLEYALEGERSFSVPSGRTDEVLHPVIAGVLNGNGITDPGETVVQTFRFSELTLIVTSDRIVKHIGGPVWDGDFEQYHYDDVTNLSFEAGSVATQIVLEANGRQQRIKAPNDRADEVSERLKRALFAYHDVDSLEAFNALVVDDEADDADTGSTVDFGAGVDPLDANPPSLEDDDRFAGGSGDEDDRTDPLTGGSALETSPDVTRDERGSANTETERAASKRGEPTTEPTATPSEVTAGSSDPDPTAADGVRSTASTSGPGSPELLERIESLEAAVDAQTELLEAQQATIEQLIEELRQGR